MRKTSAMFDGWNFRTFRCLKLLLQIFLILLNAVNVQFVK